MRKYGSFTTANIPMYPTAASEWDRLPLEVQRGLARVSRDNGIALDLIQIVKLDPDAHTMTLNFPDTTTTPRTDKVDDMANFTNPAAAALAREILSEQERETLRGTVQGAIDTLREQLTDAPAGTIYSFAKISAAGTTYYYAAIKGERGKWFTTAASPRVLENDSELIEWLISLEVYAAPMSQLTMGQEAAGAIEATATES